SHKLRVPFREIALAPSKDISGKLEENPPVRVYDTSGPWTDPDVHCNVHDGLPALRREWIVARGDVEESEGHAFTSETESADARHEFTPKGISLAPLRARSGQCVTQMHYARKGIITPEMEYVAMRENLGRQFGVPALSGILAADGRPEGEPSNDRSSLYHQHRGHSFGAAIPEFVTPEFVRDEIARG